MYFQIFGLVTKPEWWFLSRIPLGGGTELACMLQNELEISESLSFHYNGKRLEKYSAHELLELWSAQTAQIVVKPATATEDQQFDSRLRLVSIGGPDAGRIFPLTRQTLSVGRGASRAQIRDPWLSNQDFDIRLTTNGVQVTRAGKAPQLWNYGDQLFSGTTTFDLRRGSGLSVHAPYDPGEFILVPGHPPSPPNLVLQIIGAAAPLLIGVVLMLMTGMWYFLLFSGISVIIAGVLIAQYRRTRKQYLADIQVALQDTAEKFNNAAFTPDQLSGGLSSQDQDPLGLHDVHAEHPIVNVGPGRRQARLLHVEDDKRWDDYLFHRVDNILTLRPGQQTVVIGDSASLRPFRYWVEAQLFRYIKAMGGGLLKATTQLGGIPTIEFIEEKIPTPRPDLHQLIFSTNDAAAVPASATVIRLDHRTIRGPYATTDLDPFGISATSLQLITEALMLDQPHRTGQVEYLEFSTGLSQADAIQRLVTTVGVGELGLSVDLVEHGPHMLIAGTTGSGKSELVLTVLLGLAQHYSPCEVSFVLLDFKGGSSFNVLAPLPHTMSVETNHVSAVSLRSLEAIAAELYRREALFAQSEVPDFETYRNNFPNVTLPRLVVAIDELRVLVDQNAEAARTLAHLAATGRSLGFHLIVATQRTQGAVNADIRANIGCVIALRTSTEHDSWDVLGSGDAYRISPGTPGRAYFKSGAEEPREFQTSRYTFDEEPAILARYNGTQPETLPNTTNWKLAVRKLCNGTKLLSRPAPIILPALERTVTTEQLQQQYSVAQDQLPIGLVDDPARCLQYPVVLGQPLDNQRAAVLTSSVAWVGSADSGIEACQNTLIRHLATSSNFKIWFDGHGLQDSLGGWDHHLDMTGATPDRLKHVLASLHAHLSQGQQAVLLITEWGSWATALVTGSFQGLEERLIEMLRQYPSLLTLYVFGARELAGGRLLAMIPDRFYIPKGSTAEHQLIWPKLRLVPQYTARGILITAEHTSGGLEVQLCTS